MCFIENFLYYTRFKLRKLLRSCKLPFVVWQIGSDGSNEISAFISNTRFFDTEEGRGIFFRNILYSLPNYKESRPKIRLSFFFEFVRYEASCTGVLEKPYSEQA